MSSHWNSKTLSGNKAIDALQSGVLDEDVVILMQGKNTFGDRIYSYLKAKVKDVLRMQSAIKAGQPFNPSDFGTVVAAGKGEPTDEVKAEISSTYKVLDSRSAASAPPPPPTEQKAWDEY